MSFLYILEINLLSVALCANIFTHSVGCLFVLFMVSFSVQKLLSLIRYQLFVFICITLGGGSEKTSMRFVSETVLPMCSSKGFIASSILFRSLIHFEFIFVYGVSVLVSFYYMSQSRFLSTTYWRDCIFSIVYSCLLCHKSTIGAWLYLPEHDILKSYILNYLFVSLFSTPLVFYSMWNTFISFNYIYLQFHFFLWYFKL